MSQGNAKKSFIYILPRAGEVLEIREIGFFHLFSPVAQNSRLSKTFRIPYLGFQILRDGFRNSRIMGRDNLPKLAENMDGQKVIYLHCILPINLVPIIIFRIMTGCEVDFSESNT